MPFLTIRHNISSSSRSMYVFCFILLSFGYQFDGKAQSNIEYKFIGIQDGLSANSARCVHFDHKGYLWIGTNNGLNFYDNNAFTTIPQGQNNYGLEGAKIHDIQDWNENALIIQHDKGLSLIDINLFLTKNINLQSSANTRLPNQAVQVVVSKFRKGCWVMTFNEILFIDQSFTIVKRWLLPKSEFLPTLYCLPRMIEKENGDLWFLTPQKQDPSRSSDLYELSYEHPNFKALDFPFVSNMKGYSGLVRLNDHKLLFIVDHITEVTSFVFNEEDNTFIEKKLHIRSNPNFFTMLFPYKRDLWNLFIYGNDNSYVFDIHSESWSSEKIPQYVSKNFSTDVATILNDSLQYWCWRDGLFEVKIKDNDMYSNVSDVLKHDEQMRLYATPLDKHHEILLLNNYEAIITNTKEGSFNKVKFIFEKSDKNNYVKSIHSLGNQSVFMNTESGPRRLNSNSLKVEMLNDIEGISSLPNEKYFYSMNDKKGNIWLTYPNGNTIYKLDVAIKKIVPISIPDAVSTKYTSMAQDANGWCYFASLFNLDILAIHSETLKYKTIPSYKNHSIYSTDVQTIKLDRKGFIWLFTNGYGIYILNPNTLEVKKHLTTNDGLSSNYITRAIQDNNGNFWINSTHELHRVDANTFEISTVFKGQKEFIQASITSLNANNSQLFVLGKNTTYRIDIDEMNNEMLQSEIKIINITEGNMILPVFSNKIFVNYNHQALKIKFSCQGFLSKPYHSFAYRIQGKDQNWMVGENKNIFGLTNLPNGKNTIELRVCYLNGQCQEKEILVINVAPPFWQSWWFYVLIATLIVTVLYYWIRLKMAQQRLHNEKMEAQLQSLQSQMNPHFIYNSLNSINRYILKSDKIMASEYLSKFAKLIRLTLNHSTKNVIPLSNELESLNNYLALEEMRFYEKFTYEINVDPSINTEVVCIPPLLIQPYVENAIWHGLMSKKGDCVLKINFSTMDENLKIEIYDNGIGRKASMAGKSSVTEDHKSVGMSLTEQRIRIIKETLKVQAEIKITDLYDDRQNPAGTIVTLHLKNLLKIRR